MKINVFVLIGVLSGNSKQWQLSKNAMVINKKASKI